MKELDVEIKNQMNGNLYLLFGEETFLVSKYEHEIKKSIIIDNSDEMMNFHKFEGEKVSPNAIADAFTTLSFSNSRQLVIVKNSGFFYRGRTDDSNAMVDLFSDLPEDAIVVFVETNVDKRSKIYKYIVKHGKAFEFKYWDESQLSKWVISLFETENCKISANESRYLVRNLGHNMNNIYREVGKIIGFVSNGIVTKEIIDNLINKALEVKIFDLVESIGNKNSAKALEIYSNMLLTKESPIMILTMIGRQLRLILQCKTLMEEKISENEIGKKIGVHPFVASQCVSQSKNFTKKFLYQGLEEVLQTDVKIKSGEISDKLGVELIILKYSTK